MEAKNKIAIYIICGLSVISNMALIINNRQLAKDNSQLKDLVVDVAQEMRNGLKKHDTIISEVSDAMKIVLEKATGEDRIILTVLENNEKIIDNKPVTNSELDSYIAKYNY